MAPATLEWIPLPMTAAPQALGGRRLSQIVYEYESPTPTGQHVAVRLERTSTGGTRREAEFKRAASGPMSGAERASKKRCRATLFPEQQASVRKKDVQRKRRAAAATEAAAAAAAATAAAEQAEADWWEDQRAYWAARLHVKYWSDRIPAVQLSYQRSAAWIMDPRVMLCYGYRHLQCYERSSCRLPCRRTYELCPISTWL